MRRLIRVEERLKRGSVAVELERLEGRDVFIEVYADASLGNMRGEKTQIAYVVRLRDRRGNTCTILWNDEIKATVRKKDAAWKEVLAASDEEAKERCMEVSDIG